MLRNTRKFYNKACACDAVFTALVGAFSTFAVLLGVEELVAQVYATRLFAVFISLPIGFCLIFAYAIKHQTKLPRNVALGIITGMLVSVALIRVIV